jgi:hypothetical protein
VQKFTRPLTREIECAGERLALTFSEQGIAIRPVGSRKPPMEFTWGQLLGALAGRSPARGELPTAEELTEALKQLKSAAPARPAKPAEPAVGEAKPPTAQSAAGEPQPAAAQPASEAHPAAAEPAGSEAQPAAPEPATPT